MNIFKKKMWSTLTFSLSTLAILTMSATMVINEYAPLVNDFLNIETSKVVGGDSKKSQYYKSSYSNLDEMFKEKTKLMREIGQEGTVLLKNNNALPLQKGKKVGLINSNGFIFAPSHGGGSFHSTEVVKNAITLKEALVFNGLIVDETNYDNVDAIIVVIGRSQGEGTDLDKNNIKLTNEEKNYISLAKEKSSNVIVLISGDYTIEINELKNDDGIKGILKFGNSGLSGAYGLADVITGVVSPSGKLVDTFATSTLSVPAVENFGNFEYANKNKIMASQANKYVVYSEGIYTDYKYYETRYEDSVLNQGNAKSNAGSSKGIWNYKNEVTYPFGFGLSYTTFEKEILDVDFSNQKEVKIKVKVTNIGNVNGKEVVEIYYQSPYTDYDKANKIEKASVELVGFSKTKALKSGESEELIISVQKQLLPSYDYINAKTYIMDKGTYYFSIGNGSHEAINNILAHKNKTLSDGMDANGDKKLVYTFSIDKFDKETYSKSFYNNSNITNRFDDVDINYWIDNKVTYLSRSDYQSTYPKKLKIEASENMIKSYNDTKRYENGVYNDTKSRAKNDKVTYQDYVSENDVNSALKNGSIIAKNVTTLRNKEYNDEAWNEILDNLSIYEMSRMVAQGRYYINAMPSLSFNARSGGDGPAGLTKEYVYKSLIDGEKVNLTNDDIVTDGLLSKKLIANKLDAGVYASEPVLAATFNVDLASRVGDMYGEDGLYTNTSFLWGLGLNIHRTAFGGRNSEYYSSDAVLSGLIGSKVSKASKDKGVVLVAKHFVINEQEQNRIGVSTFINEQALRENYLRSFELVATSGELQGVMTAYNRIGLLSCTAEYDLVTGMLVEEWNSHAYVISDLNSPTSGLYDGNAAISAGLSTFLNNGTYDATSGAKTNTSLNCENIKNDSTLLYATREACHKILFNYIHSNAVNGISEDSRVEFVTPWWQPTLISVTSILVITSICSLVLLIMSLKKEEE